MAKVNYDFRKYLSTRNLLIATFLMTIGGLVYVLWITTRIVVLYPISTRRLDSSYSHKYSMKLLIVRFTIKLS